MPASVVYPEVFSGRRSLADFLSKIERGSGCWLWQGRKNWCGYGIYGAAGRGRTVMAHRIAHQLWLGPIPEGLDVDHLCKVRDCVNPDHLEAVTRKENIHRSPNGKESWTHCPRGHAFDERNTHIRTDGRRRCRACDNWRHKRARAA